MTDGDSRQRALGTSRVLSGIGALASCLPMMAMLPGGFAAALGFIGLGTSSAAVRALAPQLNSVAEPLLLVSSVSLAVTSLRCSRLAVASAAGGGVLLYLGMYVITRQDGTATPTLFYSGLALFLCTYAISFAQRRRAACRPLVSPRRGGRLLASTLALGLAVVAASAVSGFGAPTASATSGHAVSSGTMSHMTSRPGVPDRHGSAPSGATSGASMNSMQP